MPRGGRRQPRPGGTYANRSDLAAGPKVLAPKAAPDQEYGKAGQQIASQQAIPMGTPGVPPPGAAPAGTVPPVMPGQLTPLDAPTERPDEPLTAGAAFGAGPGPGTDDSVSGQLRALYMVEPNEELRSLIELYDEGAF